MTKLCQVVAVVAGRKEAAKRVLTDAYHVAQKPDLFAGLSKKYTPKEETGESLPPEHKPVQVHACDLIKESTEALTKLIDTIATQDVGNQKAKADITIDGKVIVPAVPVTHLLFLEKQLTDFRTFISKLPELTSAETWLKDDNTGTFYSSPIEQIRTKKVQRGLVLYPATKEHPAQTQLVTEDVPVGTWRSVFFSGACSPEVKAAMLDRIDALVDAVKTAREQANGIEVEQVSIGARLMAFIVG